MNREGDTHAWLVREVVCLVRYVWRVDVDIGDVERLPSLPRDFWKWCAPPRAVFGVSRSLSPACLRRVLRMEDLTCVRGIF